MIEIEAVVGVVSKYHSLSFCFMIKCSLKFFSQFPHLTCFFTQCHSEWLCDLNFNIRRYKRNNIFWKQVLVSIRIAMLLLSLMTVKFRLTKLFWSLLVPFSKLDNWKSLIPHDFLKNWKCKFNFFLKGVSRKILMSFRCLWWQLISGSQSYSDIC